MSLTIYQIKIDVWVASEPPKKAQAGLSGRQGEHGDGWAEVNLSQKRIGEVGNVEKKPLNHWTPQAAGRGVQGKVRGGGAG